ncbi:MAG: SOS response-associated peptidase [Gammaproteobacteria bacterium]|nr:SOS response-associated peptidase [Gammaproteobacteria bacterium]
MLKSWRVLEIIANAPSAGNRSVSMCGRFNIIDDLAVQILCERLGIDTARWPLRFSNDVAPSSRISLIRENSEGRRVDDAIWWLLLEKTPSGWRPNHRYATFNTRYDKLHKKQSVGYRPFRNGRCIIPASGFVEGLQGTKTYHQLDGTEGIGFAGLYRTWIDETTGEITYSASIITLAPHPRFSGIHEKAFPMMLDIGDEATVNRWLDPEFHKVDKFQELLKPRLVTSLRACPIDRPSTRNPVGEQFVIAADDLPPPSPLE